MGGTVMKPKRILLVLMIITLTLIGLIGVLRANSESGPPVKVFVSILPQKYFVERIAQKRAEVTVMVGPGQNPATYEPLPRQMIALAEADLYFRIGVPFETTWMERIQAVNPRMKVVDTRDGINLRTMESHHEKDSPQGARQVVKDPHIWLDPTLVKIQASTICQALSTADPAGKELYQSNLKVFLADLDKLDQELATAINALPVRKLMVFHPAWGYFTDRYDLEQIPIEIEGKEPGPQDLAEIIAYAKQEKIKVIFVQSQFSAEQATAVARAVGCQVVTIDPLAEEYLDNLRHILSLLRKELK